MSSKKLARTLLAVVTLSACGAVCAAGTGTAAPAAKKMLKRRVPKPTPVFIVSYIPPSGIVPGQNVSLEGSLPSIAKYVSSAGQPDEKHR